MVNLIIKCLVPLMLFTTTSLGYTKQINQVAKASVVKKVKDVKLEDRKKVEQFIHLVQPKYSASYIKKITDSIFKYSEKYHLDPYILVTTAYMESEFNSKSTPCIGVMQVLYSTYRSDYRTSGYNPYTLEGNIALGALELRDHLKKVVNVDRGKILDRHRLYMFSRYNGSSSRGRYATTALRTLSRIKSEPILKLKSRLIKGKI